MPSFRLLRIIPDGRNVGIGCEVRYATHEEVPYPNPGFIALSYSWGNPDPLYAFGTAAERSESDLLEPQRFASTSTHSDTERLPSCLHCEMCDHKFEGLSRKDNLARHTRLKHHRGKEYRYASLNTCHGDHRRAERSLETVFGQEDSPWLSKDVEGFCADAKTRDLLHYSDGRHENPWLDDRTHQRNVIPFSGMTKLQLLESLYASNPDGQYRISLRPHGIMHVHKQGYRDNVATATYAVGQFVSFLAMRNYELRHSVSVPGKLWSATSRVIPDKLWVALSTWKPDQVFSLHPLQYSRLQEQIPPLSASLKHYRNPSAFLFVCFGLLYGTTVLLQYRLNHRDIYQYMAVPTGIASGVIVLAASTCFACDDPMVVSTLALSVSTAMIFSMCMHAIWRMLVVPSSVRLQRQVEEWMKECALETRDTEKHVLLEEIF